MKLKTNCDQVEGFGDYSVDDEAGNILAIILHTGDKQKDKALADLFAAAHETAEKLKASEALVAEMLEALEHDYKDLKRCAEQFAQLGAPAYGCRVGMDAQRVQALIEDIKKAKKAKKA